MNRRTVPLRTACALAVAAAATLVAWPARADLVTYQVVLQADTLGPDLPAFGLASLPAAPFTGSFTLDETGLAAGKSVAAPVTALDLWIGNHHFDASGKADAHVHTDAAGHIDIALGFLLEETYAPDPADPGAVWRGLEFGQPGPENIQWWATEGPCGFDTVKPYTGIISGRCIGGLPGTVRVFELSRTALPEPATPALVLAAGIGAWLTRRRRRGQSSVVNTLYLTPPLCVGRLP